LNSAQFQLIHTFFVSRRQRQGREFALRSVSSLTKHMLRRKNEDTSKALVKIMLYIKNTRYCKTNVLQYIKNMWPMKRLHFSSMRQLVRTKEKVSKDSSLICQRRLYYQGYINSKTILRKVTFHHMEQ